MSTEKDGTPFPKEIKPDWTITVNKSENPADGVFTTHLKEMDEKTFVFAQKMIRQGNELEAVKFILKELRVGGDDLTTKHWRYINSVGGPILKMVQPFEADIKKN